MRLAGGVAAREFTARSEIVSRQIFLITRKRLGGRRKSRVRIGMVPIIFFVVLIVSAALFSETVIEPALRAISNATPAEKHSVP